MHLKNLLWLSKKIKTMETVTDKYCSPISRVAKNSYFIKKHFIFCLTENKWKVLMQMGFIEYLAVHL